MSLTEKQVARVATLARIHIEENELPDLQKDLSGILHWIDQLEKVDVTNVPSYTDFQSQSLLEREDVVTDGQHVEEILANAPEKAHNMFAVPKVVE